MITPFGLRHVLLVHGLQNSSALLDLNAVLGEPETPLRAALRSQFLGSSPGVFTYVLMAHDEDSSLRGFVQARAHKSGLVWNVTHMAPALDSSEDAATIWYRLLLHLCITAGERGAQRLLARAPEQSPAEEVFRQASFAVYSHESVFCHPSSDTAVGHLSSEIGPPEAEERLGVHRLLYRITPRLVLQAEAPDEVPAGADWVGLPLSNGEHCYVLYGRRGDIRGYLQCLLGPRGSWLRLTVHPDARDATCEMLDHGLAVLAAYPSRPLYCAVREYEGGMQGPLEERGFALAGTYSLLVKHTTVRVKKPVRKLVSALEKRAEVAPTVSRLEGEFRTD